MKTGILLINVGTPDAPTPAALRRYLTQFLSDPGVIDINPVLRWLLVHLVIVPLRSPKSAALYQKIWTPEGSPLLVNTLKLARALEKSLNRGSSLPVEVGMRYGNPSIQSALKKLVAAGAQKIRVFPLYPQYSFSTSRSSIEETERSAERLGIGDRLEFLPPFYDHPGFIRSFAEIGRPFLTRDIDHILFSFHGLPEKQIRKGDPYQGQCFRTAELLAGELALEKGRYSISFQSRLGRTEWIKPYTDLELARLAREGKKRVVVFCPSFVADCLETLEEIGIRGRESFLGNGGESLSLVPSLNDHPTWVEVVADLVTGFSIREQNRPRP